MHSIDKRSWYSFDIRCQPLRIDRALSIKTGAHLLMKIQICSQNAGTINAVFPLPEPSDLISASQVAFDDLQTDLKELGKQLNICQGKVDKVLRLSEKNRHSPFKDFMECFLEQSREDLQEQEQALQECMSGYVANFCVELLLCRCSSVVVRPIF